MKARSWWSMRWGQVCVCMCAFFLVTKWCILPIGDRDRNFAFHEIVPCTLCDWCSFDTRFYYAWFEVNSQCASVFGFVGGLFHEIPNEALRCSEHFECDRRYFSVFMCWINWNRRSLLFLSVHRKKSRRMKKRIFDTQQKEEEHNKKTP